MRTTIPHSRRVALTFLGALAAALVSLSLTAAPAAAKPETPVPVCAGGEAKAPLVDVTQDVRNQAYLPARDGRLWANFDYSQHLQIWGLGGRQYCIRKDIQGTWVSVAGLSPNLTGTISDGITGTFHNTEFWEWTGTLTPLAPTSGYLGVVDAGCTAVNVCGDNSYLIVDTFYFPQGSLHCNAVRMDLEVDGGQHGHLSLVTDGNVQRVTVTGDITG